MKRLTTADLGGFITQTSVVLRMLREADTTMTYGEFAEIIGLRGRDEPWLPSHRQQVALILNLTAVTAHAIGDDLNKKDFARVVNARTGKPGQGLELATRLVRTLDASEAAYKAAATRKLNEEAAR